MSNILLIFAHPDDELLACGASLLRWKREKGKSVSLLTLSPFSPTREAEIAQIADDNAEKLGINKVYWGKWAAMQFGQIDRYEVTQLIESVIQQEKPDIVITHDENDLHNDHRLTNQWVREAAVLPMRHFGCGYLTQHENPQTVITQDRGYLTQIYTAEILTSTDWGSGFIPNAFKRVNKQDIEVQAALLERYDNVMRPVPHPRNAETLFALARYRGGQCGVEYAEAYRKIFEVTI